MEVPSLYDITTTKIIHEIWKKNGCEAKLIHYTLEMKRDILRQSSFIVRYSNAVKNCLSKILDLDCLPKPILFRLGCCFLDFESELLRFGIFLVTSIKNLSRKNVTTAIQNIVVGLDGHIDKPKSIINVAIRSDVSCVLNCKFTAHFCVHLRTVLDYWNYENKKGTNVRKLETLPSSFMDPTMFWRPNCNTDPGNYITFYQSVAINGNKEALEYFMPKPNSTDQQAKLCQAFIFCLQVNCNLEKILFFKSKLEPMYWAEILRRKFFQIFSIVYKSNKYRPLCCEMYEQVQDKLDFKVVESVMDHVWTEAAIETGFGTCQTHPLYKELRISGAEKVFQSIWHATSDEFKKKLVKKLFKYLNFFILKERLNILASIVDDDVFDIKQKKLLGVSVILSLVASGKESLIESFSSRLRKETYDTFKTNADVLTNENFEYFVLYGDYCVSCEQYDHVLSFKLPAFDELRNYKQSLAYNNEFMTKMITGIGEGIINVNDLGKFITWAFSNSTKMVHNYVHEHLLPTSMIEIYKNYLLGTRRSFYTIYTFLLTDAQIQNIRRVLSTDTETLQNHVLTLALSNDFMALPKLLTSVFPSPDDRVRFMQEFFTTEKGVRAVYSLIISESYDDKIFSRYEFKDKLKSMLRFKKHWLISDGIVMQIERILDEHLAPTASCPHYEFDKHLQMLPNESEGVFTAACETNFVVLKCVLRNSVVIDLMNNIMVIEH